MNEGEKEFLTRMLWRIEDYNCGSHLKLKRFVKERIQTLQEVQR